LLDVARTIAAEQFVPDPRDPFEDSEIEETARSAWKYEVEGLNWVGRAGRVYVSAEEQERLMAHPKGADMALLLLRLRRAHWDRLSFAVSPKAMADHRVIPDWGRSPGRYRRAVAGLVEVDILRIERLGGSKRGDVRLYSLTGERGAGGGG